MIPQLTMAAIGLKAAIKPMEKTLDVAEGMMSDLAKLDKRLHALVEGKPHQSAGFLSEGTCRVR